MTRGLHGRALRVGTSVAALVLAGAVGLTRAEPVSAPAVVIRTDDVDRFFQVYEAAKGHPSAEELGAGYLQPGSPALHAFVKARIGSADRLARAVNGSPQVYATTSRCRSALPAARQRLPGVLEALHRQVPTAVFPPITVVVGSNNSGGTTTSEGVTIGLETVCRSTWLQPDPADRLVHLIAHEYAHIQQPAAALDDDPKNSLLFLSLIEGGAELVAELTSGEVSNVHLQAWTRGHECAVERAFAHDAGGTDVSKWLYNGVGTPQEPGDLGYWVGYRIAKSFYQRATDKQHALQELLTVSNESAPDLLRRSGWSPACGPAGAA